MNNELFEKATELVTRKITGDRKGLPGSPAYEHSLRVAEMLREQGSSPEACLAGLLHDIVEDGGVPFDELNEMGFPDRTIELVRLCTHPMDVQGSTERWVLMMAKLVQAKDEDAWRIKLADLADNLTQSHGLSPEHRRFMVEVKAPLMLRLAKIEHSAWGRLKEEMERRREIL